MMRSSDLTRLNQPYPDGAEPGDGLALSALGLPLRRWKELETLILNDFVEQSPYGIGWWAPHPGTSRRILISDQLYACVTSVAANMTEAVLHWLEYQDWAERDSERYADIVQFREGQFDVVLPRPRNAMEELSREMVVMHIAGMARALSGALDCLAGAIIGVVAVPLSILRADLGGKLRDFFKKLGQGTTDGEKAQADFYRKFNDVVASAGPDGWLEWALDFRNMLVHRGRRTENGEFVKKGPQLYGADGEQIPRVRRLTYLPRNPSMSDVEVWRETPVATVRDPLEALVLNEDAAQTLNGLLDSTKAMISGTAKLLIDVWKWRQGNPQILTQPRAQWPKGPSTSPAVIFQGYAPRTRDLSRSAVALTHPIASRRFLAASLDDANRQQWDTFD
jgi:hypothetical protein